MRLPERWTNGIKKTAGTNCDQVAMDRTKWMGLNKKKKISGVAFGSFTTPETFNLPC